MDTVAPLQLVRALATAGADEALIGRTLLLLARGDTSEPRQVIAVPSPGANSAGPPTPIPLPTRSPDEAPAPVSARPTVGLSSVGSSRFEYPTHGASAIVKVRRPGQKPTSVSIPVEELASLVKRLGSKELAYDRVRRLVQQTPGGVSNRSAWVRERLFLSTEAISALSQ